MAPARGPWLCGMTLPRNAGLPQHPPCGGPCWGRGRPFSLAPFAITIYLSLEVEGTRACNWERLGGARRSPCLGSASAAHTRERNPSQERGGVGEPGLKGHRAGKGTTHTR